MRLVDILRTRQTARSFREKLVSLQVLSSSPHKSLNKYLSRFEISKIIDGGANVGQFGLDLYRHGYAGSIYSYEPIKNIFVNLEMNAKKFDKWFVFNQGLGEKKSTATINISGNSGLSSSLLQMNDTHLKNFPRSLTVAQEKVLMTSIATEIDSFSLYPANLAIKLDVQGYEYQALLGAGKFLKKVPICFIEVSLIPLYEGEYSLVEILNLLSESGHQVVDVFRGATAQDGSLLQIDVVTLQKDFH